MQFFQIRKIIIIGGGNKVLEILPDIKQLIAKKSNCALVFSSSRFFDKFEDVDVAKYISLIGVDAKRAIDKSKDFSNTSFVTFSSEFEVNTLIPEVIFDKSFELKELISNILPVNTTNLSLSLANTLTDNNIYICGYDGYSEINIGKKENKLLADNNLIFEELAKNHKDKFKFLYPAKYGFLDIESIYSLI